MAPWLVAAVNINHRFDYMFESKWSKDLLQRLIAAQLVKKFPASYRT
jgi:hypothetical protein